MAKALLIAFEVLWNLSALVGFILFLHIAIALADGRGCLTINGKSWGDNGETEVANG